MPKFIINSTGDQFFLPDSSQFYFDELLGTKYLRYVPNSEHGMRGTAVRQTMLACYNAVLENAALPKFTWTVEKNGPITVKTVDKPAAVKVWQATNPKARDFQLRTLGAVWKDSPLAEQETGLYVAKVPAPPEGWTAFVVELTYPSTIESAPYKFTTEVHVVPDRLPFKFEPQANPPKGFLQNAQAK